MKLFVCLSLLHKRSVCALCVAVCLSMTVLLVGCGRVERSADGDEVEVACVDSVVNAPLSLIEQRMCVSDNGEEIECDTCVVVAGETISGILHRHGISQSQWSAFHLLLQREPQLSRIREGATYYVAHSDSALVRYAYRQSLRDILVVELLDSVYVEHVELPIDIESRTASLTVRSSLWQAIVQQGLPVELALDLSEIYAWTINFFALQVGDSVRVLYDEQYVEGQRVGIGRIYAAQFLHAGRWTNAYYAQLGDTVRGYYDEEGKSLRKTFLKAPLNYKRISSHFTYARKHPIYHTVRPHTGVDYAAPAGTPVVALGDGTVTFCAYKGGGGNTIRIRHNSIYETAYLHLSRYASGLRVGKRVEQGEVIGYVGSTGASTGPHLDFRVWKNGTPVNPLTLESPSAEPVPDSLMTTYSEQVRRYEEQLFNQP